VVSVPAGATTGPLGVSTPLGSAASAAPFVVIGTIAVAPGLTDVQVGLTRQFEATEDGAPTTGVLWSVNGIVGGDTTVGTISTTGLYTAPGVVPVPPTVTVTATHQTHASASASAQAVVLDAGPRFGAAAAVSLAFAAPASVVDRSVTASVSVQVAPTAPAFAAGPAVSLTVAPPAPVVQGVSTLLSLALEPVVTGLTPTAVPAGSTFSLTVSGSGLAGTTVITFLRNDAADAAITVSNVTPGGDGTSVTADIDIAAGATPGGRVIQVTAGGAVSTPASTGGNVFTVQ
jgi:hypothetical protein